MHSKFTVNTPFLYPETEAFLSVQVDEARGEIHRRQFVFLYPSPGGDPGGWFTYGSPRMRSSFEDEHENCSRLRTSSSGTARTVPSGPGQLLADLSCLLGSWLVLSTLVETIFANSHSLGKDLPLSRTLRNCRSAMLSVLSPRMLWLRLPSDPFVILSSGSFARSQQQHLTIDFTRITGFATFDRDLSRCFCALLMWTMSVE